MNNYKGLFTYDVDNHRYIQVEQAKGIINCMNYQPEPKPQVVYYIDRDGEIVPYKNVEYPKRVFNTEQNREIGNHFETREEAEKAVEKLKAWKRLKDKGFKFTDWCRDSVYGLSIQADELHDCGTMGMIDELNLLFGGEDV